ncbi:lytic transglycosylase domain-containing protein [Sphingobium yanoikuyae]|uniref:lytic transglycosylase domain-containing protein n=1 Tax=Sphingobium yanoikuyae TaxID=13690 RepID=UPI0035C6DBBE
MAPLIRILAAAMLLMSPASGTAQRAMPPAAPGAAIERWRPLIAQAAQRFGVPEAWIAAVMKAESGGHTHLDGHPIVSRAGAMGLMQLMPGTWAAMRARYGLGSDPHDPHDNILAGTAYLRIMYESFGYPGLFAAYNAGPGRYSEHLRSGRVLPAETRLYIEATSAKASMPPPILSGTRLFFTLNIALKPAASPASKDDATAHRSLIIAPSAPRAEGSR